MLNSSATRQHLRFYFLFLLFNKAMLGKTLRGRCWAVGPALKNNSSNCLVLIPHRQLGNCLLGTGESYGMTAQHSQDSV